MKESDESIKNWSVQDRKGKACWQTVKNSLVHAEAEKLLDKLAASKSLGNYTYRMKRY
ncbi:MAG: hypothetical protein G5663_01615 [Serratia symbiotica]|nr:hypothetical protein [Serratia symbiotica]